MKIYIPPKYNKENKRQIWFLELENHPIITDMINGLLLAILIVVPVGVFTPFPLI